MLTLRRNEKWEHQINRLLRAILTLIMIALMFILGILGAIAYQEYRSTRAAIQNDMPVKEYYYDKRIQD